MATINVDVKLNSTKSQKSAERLSKTFNDVQNNVNKTNKSVDLLNRTLKSISRSASSLARNFFDSLMRPLSEFSQKLLELFDAVDITNVYSSFLGFRNALALASLEAETLSEKISIANTNLAYASKIAMEYKVNVVSLTREYSKFVNSVVLSGKSINDANKYFETFSRLARILNLNGQEVSGMFLALEQMISKGFVSMEELRRQLGQYIPGAMELAARSMGYGAGELKKFYDLVSSGKLVTKDFMENFVAEINSFATNDLLTIALKKPQAALEGLNNTFTILKATLGSLVAGPFTKIIESIDNIIKKIIFWIGPTDEIINALMNTDEATNSVSDSLNTASDNIDSFKKKIENAKTEVESFVEPFKDMAFTVNEASSGFAALFLAAGPVITLLKKIKDFVVAIFIRPLGKIIAFIGRILYLITLFARLHPATALAAAGITALVYSVLEFNSSLDEQNKKLKESEKELENYTKQINEAAKAADVISKNNIDLSTVIIGVPRTLEDYSKQIINLNNKLEELKSTRELFAENGDSFVLKQIDEEIKRLEQRLKGVIIRAGKIYKETIDNMSLGNKVFSDSTEIVNQKTEELANRLAYLNEIKSRGMKLGSLEAKVLKELIENNIDLNSEKVKTILYLARETELIEKGIKQNEKNKKVIKDNTKEIKKLNMEIWIKTEALKGNKLALDVYNATMEAATLREQAQKIVMEDTTLTIEEKKKKLEELYALIDKYQGALIQDIIDKNKIEEDIKETKDQIDSFVDNVMQAFERFSEGFNDAIAQAITGGIKSFEDFKDIIKNLMLQLLRDLIKMALANPITFVGDVIGGIGSYFGLPTGPMSNVGTLGNIIGGVSTAASTASFMLGGMGGGQAAMLASQTAEFGLYGTYSTLTSGGMSSFGAALATAAPYVIPLALAAFALSGGFSDKEAPSEFYLKPGKVLGPRATNTAFGKQYVGDEGLEAATYVGKLGTVAFGGRHFGKDEQLSDEERIRYVQEMIGLFSQLDQLDKTLIDTFGFSSETINKLKEEIDNLPDTAKEWGKPNISKYLIEKYSIIFEEAGGILKDVFVSLTQNLGLEEVVQVVQMLVQLQSALTTLSDVSATATEIIDAQNATLTETFNNQEQALYTMLGAYDGSIQATNELTAGLGTFAQTAIQLITQIREEANKAKDVFANTKEKILLDTLNDTEKYSYYKSKYDTSFDKISSAASPEELSKIVADLNSYANKMWDIQKSMEISPDELKEKSQEWFAALDKADELTAEKFAEFEKQAAEQAANMSKAASDILSASAAMKQASDTMNNAAGEMNSAASNLWSALANMNVSVTVNQSSTEIFAGEIG